MKSTPEAANGAGMYVPRLYLALAAVLVGGFLTGLWCQRDAGLADNGDFNRAIFAFTSGPVGQRAGTILFDTEEGQKRFFHDWLPRWEPRWTPARPASSVEGLWAPGLVACAAGAGSGKIDLRVLSVFPKLLLLGELLVLLVWIGRQTAYRYALLAALGVPMVLLFTTTDYLAYLQSFYQEAASLVFVLPFLFSLVYFRRHPSPGRLAVTLVCLALLTTAKSSTFYWPALTLPFLLSAWFADRPARPEHRRWLTVALSVVGTMAFTLASLRATRVGGSEVNPYHSFFYGALTFSREPAAHLDRMGLQNARDCVGQAAYTPAGSRFLAEHPHGVAFRATLLTYLREPGAIVAGGAHVLGNMQDVSLEYLGKYAHEDPRSAAYASTDYRGRETRFWRADVDGNVGNAWSTLKFWCFPTGGALAICLAVFAGWFGRGLRASTGPTQDLATVGLIATLGCAVDMAVAILGDGRFELIKHLFLANLLFDIAAIAFLGSLAVWIRAQVGPHVNPG